jgi:peptide/nickel transport system substrate-binding protein
MKRIFLLLAAVSTAVAGFAATRPHYGGSLRIEVRGTLSSFETSETANASRQILRDLILGTVCDRLTKLNASGELQPSLALSWRSDADGRSWYFVLRPNILLQNGNALSPQVTAAAISGANPGWQVRLVGSELLIRSDTASPNLPYELAETQNSVCIAGDSGRWIGSGPYEISNFQEGQRIELTAFDDAWEGRPFIDRVAIEMGKSFADQLADFQLGKADVIEADPAQPSSGGSAKTSISEPVELFALIFTPNHPFSADASLRESIARAIDRNSIYSVLLRRQGDPESALLPEWISGYAHLLDAPQDLPGARQLRSQVTMLAPLSLAYDRGDDLGRLIAERIALNARESGLTVQPRPETPAFRGFNADLQLIRLRIESPNPSPALSAIGDVLDVATLQRSRSARTLQEIHSIESEALKNYNVIPIVHEPEAFVHAVAVHDWTMTPWGEINLGNIWMEASK